MSTARKNLQNFEKILKRIEESISSFDTHYEQYQNIGSTTQKSKLEDELKKENKKLQKFREELRTQSGLNPRSTEQAQDARLKIEERMVLYKNVEKESKSRNKDADSEFVTEQSEEERRKDVMREWIEDFLSSLQSEQSAAESEVSLLESGKGRKASKEQSKLTSLKNVITTHQFHIDKLQLVLDYLDQNLVSADTAEYLKDELDEYLEHCREIDYSNDEFLYDDIETAAEEAGEAAKGVHDTSVSSSNAPLSNTTSQSTTSLSGSASNSVSSNVLGLSSSKSRSGSVTEKDLKRPVNASIGAVGKPNWTGAAAGVVNSSVTSSSSSSLLNPTTVAATRTPLSSHSAVGIGLNSSAGVDVSNLSSNIASDGLSKGPAGQWRAGAPNLSSSFSTSSSNSNVSIGPASGVSGPSHLKYPFPPGSNQKNTQFNSMPIQKVFEDALKSALSQYEIKLSSVSQVIPSSIRSEYFSFTDEILSALRFPVLDDRSKVNSSSGVSFMNPQSHHYSTNVNP